VTRSRRVNSSAKGQATETGPTQLLPVEKPRGILVFVGLVAFLTFAGGLLLGAHNFLQYRFVRAGPLTQEVVFTVPKGADVSSIATRLESESLVDSARMFRLMVRMDGNDTGLKAGEFAVPAKSSMRDIFEILIEGKTILYPFTAVEGLTSAMIVRSMDGLTTLIDDNPEIPAEGTLLPETYMTPRGMTQSRLIARMQADQKVVLDKLWAARQEGLPIRTRQEALILASIVEKETGIGSEREKVAGVFINRLNRGMRLESDPTIIYGITGGEPLGRGIRRSEIDSRTDWNTYQIDGLPITPICNPGKESIQAVLNPAKTDAIFFVADGSGGHVFARTLSEHNRNVANWRKIERQLKLRQ